MLLKNSQTRVLTTLLGPHPNQVPNLNIKAGYPVERTEQGPEPTSQSAHTSVTQNGSQHTLMGQLSRWIRQDKFVTLTSRYLANGRGSGRALADRGIQVMLWWARDLPIHRRRMQWA